MSTQLCALRSTVLACTLALAASQSIVKELRIPSHDEGDWTLLQLLDDYRTRRPASIAWDDEALTLAHDTPLGLLQPQVVPDRSLDSFVSAMLHAHDLATLTLPNGDLRVVLADASRITSTELSAAERVAQSRTPSAQWVRTRVSLRHLSIEDATRWLPEVWPLEVEGSGTGLMLEGPRAMLCDALQLLSRVDREPPLTLIRRVR